jgi:hypothetical protein
VQSHEGQESGKKEEEEKEGKVFFTPEKTSKD